MIVKRGNEVNSKGQVTIFIIIAILIIALAVLAYFLFPKLKTTISGETQTPSQYIDTCMREKIENTIETVSLNGGDYAVNEEFSYNYRGDYIKYLCYTNEYYKECKNQEPFISEHIEEEISNEISYSANSCFEEMIAGYRNKGYEANLVSGDTIVEILPKRIAVSFNNELTLTKEDTQTYNSFNIILNSNLYELLDVTKNIVLWERDTGESVPEAYMYYNPYLKVEKKRYSDETKVYTITDRKTNDIFRFAIRSWAMPPGY